MKIGIGLAAALAVAILSPSAVFAQAKVDAATAKLRQQGMADAPAVVQAKGLACTVTDALLIGEVQDKGPDGKPVKAKAYEVACQEGLGYMVGNPVPEPLACLALDTVSAQDGKKYTGYKCKLPANADPKQGLAPILQKAGGGSCTPAKARWIGMSSATKIDQYEVGCADGQSFLVTAPRPGSTAKLTVDNCMRSPEACQYYSKAATIQAISTLAAKSGRSSCEITDARYVATKTAGGDFYEVACKDGKSGYFLETDPNNAFKSTVECARADNIAGGCTMTKIAVTGSTEEAASYTKGAIAAGFKCNVSQYRSLGRDSQGRELAEVACTDRPDGAFVMIPLEAGQKGDSYNCVRAEARGQSCKLSQKSAMFEKIHNQLENKSKACVIANTRGIGPTPTGEDVVEISCTGAPGVVAVFYKDSDGIGLLMPCDKAQQVGGCKLPPG